MFFVVATVAIYDILQINHNKHKTLVHTFRTKDLITFYLKIVNENKLRKPLITAMHFV